MSPFNAQTTIWNDFFCQANTTMTFARVIVPLQSMSYSLFSLYEWTPQNVCLLRLTVSSRQGKNKPVHSTQAFQKYAVRMREWNQTQFML